MYLSPLHYRDLGAHTDVLVVVRVIGLVATSSSSDDLLHECAAVRGHHALGDWEPLGPWEEDFRYEKAVDRWYRTVL